MPPGAETVTSLLAEFRKGNNAATGRLVELLYPELRKLAAAKMRGERTEHTWQPTLLVNELYLALVKIKACGDDAEGVEQKSAFLGLAGHIMKRLLIEHARRLYRKAERVEWQDGHVLIPSGAESLHDVEKALTRLGTIDPKLRAVTEMRVFEGLTREEIAGSLNCSVRTVANYWNFARLWLQKELADSSLS